MTLNLQKELRTLAIPAGALLAITLASAWGARDDRMLSWQSMLSGRIAFLAFFLGAPLLAALSFGEEFHHRTLILSLTQPVSRARLWFDKGLAVVSVVALLVGTQLVVFSLRRPFELPLLSAIMFVVMVVSSAPLWTLVARSTIGGLVFTVSVIMIQELVLGGYRNWVLGITNRPDAFEDLGVLHLARAAYAVVSMGLGWWVFARFQTAGVGPGAGAGASGGWAILRARRGGVLANIIRKELMLQRPAFMAAAAFVACWLVALAVVGLQARPEQLGDVVFPLLFAVYMPLVIVLAGTMSAGEEGALGIKAWHLTLPLSARAQWGAKFGVSLVVGLLLATVVPGSMAALLDLFAKGHVREGLLLQPVWVALLACALAVAFWASTLLGETVKASLATGGMVVVMGLAASAATNYSFWAARHADWLVRLVAPLQVSPRQSDAIVQAGIAFVALAIASTAAWQSRNSYPRLRTSSATFVRLAAVLVVVAVTTAFGAGLFLTAIELNFQRTRPASNSIQVK